MGNMFQFQYEDGVYSHVDQITGARAMMGAKQTTGSHAPASLGLYYVYRNVHESTVTSQEWARLRSGIPAEEVFAHRFTRREVVPAVRMVMLASVHDLGEERLREMLSYEFKAKVSLVTFRKRVSNESQDRLAACTLSPKFIGNRQEKLKAVGEFATFYSSRINDRQVIYAHAAGRELVFGYPDDLQTICE